MKKIVYIGLGSNLGDKEENIRFALNMIAETPGVNISGVAPLYKTAPVGMEQQDWFLNTVVEVSTDLAPLELLHKLQEIENRMGRVRKVHWGPRIIDLDLLLYGDEAIDIPGLTVPHPMMGERAFVLVPLAHLNPDLVLPGWGGVAELAVEMSERQQISLHLIK
ncbi:MAG: 2-amino-4-hydroxy-6-hydroxymethyldihydropteridine pyrophosphokinase [Peptococcaceae bacterium BRH_c4b]|nr:MAG: 2-amino-4-hydroxy-6-hydroxymethyldihydropteridine pyrophosphokinase [Peptococcaceae bacterium BRH_c4b]